MALGWGLRVRGLDLAARGLGLAGNINMGLDRSQRDTSKVFDYGWLLLYWPGCSFVLD
jgi:hypothetical protein